MRGALHARVVGTHGLGVDAQGGELSQRCFDRLARRHLTGDLPDLPPREDFDAHRRARLHLLRAEQVQRGDDLAHVGPGRQRERLGVPVGRSPHRQRSVRTRRKVEIDRLVRLSLVDVLVVVQRREVGREQRGGEGVVASDIGGDERRRPRARAQRQHRSLVGSRRRRVDANLEGADVDAERVEPVAEDFTGSETRRLQLLRRTDGGGDDQQREHRDPDLQRGDSIQRRREPNLRALKSVSIRAARCSRI